ncbi:MOSC domain-containing protein [Actinokineospora xionganensis]|uniref:YaeP family protein n=1 Tax=Actinokineospora xionganensis TaxID=2684470 RepID=A0ABR7LDQ0_9PSEU|nr:MOSC N-terminal beta barrel domain-containing protein [Actinokineospora xionganensis]MBC6450623.1 YaeP family protein [Actinokineospora xionganensis]
MAIVTDLKCFPIKGCAGVPLADALMTSAGLAHDRTFMVIGEDGVFRSQRRSPRLAVIEPSVSAAGDRITLRAPGFTPVDVEVDLTRPRRDLTMFGDPYRGIDLGGEAAAWLSEVLGERVRLVRVPPEHDRVTDGQVPGTSGYADSSAVHLLSRSTLAELNTRLVAAGADPMPLDRFRANLVIDGWAEPSTEDRVRRVRIGDCDLGYTKLAIRCVVTTVDQEAGTKAGPEPLRTLAAYRRAAAGGVSFGAKFSVLRTGKLSVGDALTVDTWGESEF